MINTLGHKALSAHTGEQALSILRDTGHEIDWLVADIRLPGSIDGWLVGSEFALTRPLQPVIYMSGATADFPSRRASNSIFLQKPLYPTALVAVFERLSENGLADLDSFVW